MGYPWGEKSCDLEMRCQELQKEVDYLQIIVDSYRKMYSEVSKESLYKHLSNENKCLRRRLRGMRKQFKQYSAYFGGLVVDGKVHLRR
jgi:hypothetical protein